MIYTSKVISIHYHGNIIDSNHGNGTQPNKDFKTLLKAPSQWPSSLIYGHEFFFLEHDTVEEKVATKLLTSLRRWYFRRKYFSQRQLKYLLFRTAGKTRSNVTKSRNCFLHTYIYILSSVNSLITKPDQYLLLLNVFKTCSIILNFY